MKRSILFAVALSACATTTPKKEEQLSSRSAQELREAARQAAIDALERNFARVHFEFDSALITKETRAALAANVEIMRAFPELSVEIEGHCDELGTSEYNLALGERRAEAIRAYMERAGISTRLITTVSYGEERPLVGGDDPSQPRNRRAEFRVKVAPDGVRGTVALHSSNRDSRLVAR